MIQKVITNSDTNNNDYNKMFSNDNGEKLRFCHSSFFKISFL